MKITAVDVFPVQQFVYIKISTDYDLYGIGEASGWPRVVETAIHDMTPLMIGEDPFHIEKLWSKMQVAIMSHGMTGIEMGNPNLKPLRSTNFDISLERYNGSTGAYSIAAFYKSIDNFCTGVFREYRLICG